MTSPRDRALDFYFDFISPYAYLAFTQLPALRQRTGAVIRYQPVLFAGLLGAHGQLGPAEITKPYQPERSPQDYEKMGLADRAIDLVVMSTHGRTGVRRWMYGSVANKVLRDLTHPLLLIPSRAAAEDA